MFPEYQIPNSCHTILSHVRMSGLNFSIQETPFSFYISVRKSKIKYQQVDLPDQQQSYLNLESNHNRAIEQLRSRCELLENANVNLKRSYEEAIEGLEVKTKNITDLQNVAKNLVERLEESNNNTTSVKKFSDEKRA